MSTRAMVLLAALGLTGAAFAQPADSPEPHLVLQVRSINSLRQDVAYLLKVGGEDARAEQVDGLFKNFLGGKQAQALDLEKPLGLVVTVAPQVADSSIILLVPIVKEQAVLEILEGFGVKAERDVTGVYSIPLQQNNFLEHVHLRFANNYAYFATRREALDRARLPRPGDVLNMSNVRLLSLRLRLQSIADQARESFLKGIEYGLGQAARDKNPDKTETQRQAKEALVHELFSWMQRIVREGQEVGLHYDVNRTAGEQAAELTLTAQPGSTLAKSLANLGSVSSPFAGLIGKDSAAHLMWNIPLSGNMKKALGKVVEAWMQEEFKKPPDTTRKAEAGALLRSLTPAQLVDSMTESAATLRGPGRDGTYVALGAFRFRKDAETERLYRKVLSSAETEGHVKIRWDAHRIGDVSIHRLDILDPIGPELQRIFGEKSPILLAFGAEAAFYAWGDNALPALQEAMRSPPAAAPLFRLEASMGRLWPIINTLAQKELKLGEPKQPAGGIAGHDRMHLTVTGGSALTVRVALGTGTARYLAPLLPTADEATKENKSR